MVNEIIQRPQDCIYGFFSNDAVKTFQPNKLTILCDDRLQIPPLFIYAAVIGESHFIQITLGKKLLAIELLACVNLSKIGFKPNFRHSFKESSILQKEIKDGDAKIQIKATIHPLTRNRERFVPVAPQNGLYIVHEFPGIIKPRTIVAVKVEDRVIEIQTLHEYVLGKKIEPLISWTRISYLG